MGTSNEIDHLPAGKATDVRVATLALAHPTLWTAADVAAYLHKNLNWVKQHSNGHRRPLLPSIKAGKERLYRPSEIEAFLDRWSESDKEAA
jgi:hypothetical protein